ncbi:hypothetical protein [Dactylosporangium sp. CA-139066]|uniref:hypothetical protein n=1 Tax=Dactylosporangium sp. CA-139066 TaxID=3239930 RepID=UPI003D919EA3
MAEALALHPEAPPIAAIKAWAEALNDDQVLERQERLGRLGRRSDLQQLDTVVRGLLEEVRQQSE